MGKSSTSASATLTVIQPTGHATIQASPTAIVLGQTTTLSWTTQNAVSATITPGIGIVATQGSITVSPPTTTTYTIVANGSAGPIASASVTVTVVPTRSGLNAINHIVVMMQENRSFDSYFGHLNDYRLSVGLPQDIDGIPPGASNPLYRGAGTVPSFHLSTVCTEDLSPAWNQGHLDWNVGDPTSSIGLLNGFVITAGSISFIDSKGIRAMGYYDSNDLPYYAFMASEFATSNRWFSPVMSKSQPNRLYAIAATSAGYAYKPTVPLANPTIFQLLETAGISWKVYVTDPGDTYLSYFQPFASQHASNIVPASQFVTDAANGTLPAVSWIEPGFQSGLDEHPTANVQKGAAYVSGLVNGLMTSQSWPDSVFILSFDEGGAIYDHVPPPTAVSPDNIPPLDLAAGDVPGDFTRYGYRVPMLVISPFTRPHYVSQTVADHTAILKMIETRFNLPNLTARDAAQMDMTEFFDFQNIPWLVPPVPPVQPTNGACYYDHLP
jgi:phospholipase C